MDIMSFIYFNSIKVQLEQLLPCFVQELNPFQFHKGTIRTVDSFISHDHTFRFQFHKGTIRTHYLAAEKAFAAISIP